MRLKITAFFMTHIYTSPEKFIEKTKAQPTKRIANCPVDNVASTCLSHTIRIMVLFCFSQIYEYLTYIRYVYASNMKYVHFNRRLFLEMRRCLPKQI